MAAFHWPSAISAAKHWTSPCKANIDIRIPDSRTPAAALACSLSSSLAISVHRIPLLSCAAPSGVRCLLLVTQTGDTGDIGDITGPGPVPVNIRALVQGNWAVNFLITTLFTMLRVSGLKRMPLLGAHAAYRIALSCSKTRHTSLIGAGAIALSEAQASSWQRYKCSWACCEVAWSRGVVQSCSRAVVDNIASGKVPILRPQKENRLL
jgi:hypothetical protein